MALSTGAMSTTPATPWSSRRSTDRVIEGRSRVATLSTLTAKPAPAAVCATAASMDAGPNSVECRLTTPRVCERPVASARAARFGR